MGTFIPGQAQLTEGPAESGVGNALLSSPSNEAPEEKSVRPLSGRNVSKSTRGFEHKYGLASCSSTFKETTGSYPQTQEYWWLESQDFPSKTQLCSSFKPKPCAGKQSRRKGTRRASLTEAEVFCQPGNQGCQILSLLPHPTSLLPRPWRQRTPLPCKPSPQHPHPVWDTNQGQIKHCAQGAAA